MISVAHVITTLDTGGAETALTRLLAHTDPSVFSTQVISLAAEGALAPVIREQGWQVRSLDASRGLGRSARLLHRWLREDRPDVVQTWLYHADVFGGAVARAAGVPAVAWNLRSSDLTPGAFRRSTIATARVAARLSRALPTSIVCGSQAARTFHEGLGYDSARMVVIPNGFTVAPLDPHERTERRKWLRACLRVPEDSLLVGRVARFHPHKDYFTLLAAFSRLAAVRGDVQLVLCGEGVEASNHELRTAVAATGARQRVHLLGNRRDVEGIHAGLDVACSSSLGEGFPNVVGEAMAQAVPVVVTDVGDSALLVADTGRVVPPRNAPALAAALAEVLALSTAERFSMGMRARQRVADHFSVERMADAHNQLYCELASRSRNRRVES